MITKPKQKKKKVTKKKGRKKISSSKKQKPNLTPAHSRIIGKQLDLTVSDDGMISNFSNSPVIPIIKKKQRGVEKSARLLLALGPDQASQILKEMEPSEVESLMREMIQINNISPSEKKDILGEFEQTVTDFEAPIQGGIDQARKMLEMGLGKEKAEELLGKLNQQDLFKDFSFLEKIDPAILASTLGQEHTQIIAVALSYLKPRTAANVMRLLPETCRADVAMRIARTTRINPESIHRVAKVLREKFEKRSQEQFSEVGGANSLADILNHMDRNQEDEILDILGKREPEMLEDVKDKLYTFEELLNLTQKEMRQLIARVSDDEIISTALRGADDELKRHFFHSMSNNRAADILDEMDHKGPLTMREINEGRAYVLNMARKLDDENVIIIKKTKEEYV